MTQVSSIWGCRWRGSPLSLEHLAFAYLSCVVQVLSSCLSCGQLSYPPALALNKWTFPTTSLTNMSGTESDVWVLLPSGFWGVFWSPAPGVTYQTFRSLGHVLNPGNLSPQHSGKDLPFQAVCHQCSLPFDTQEPVYPCTLKNNYDITCLRFQTQVLHIKSYCVWNANSDIQPHKPHKRKNSTIARIKESCSQTILTLN